MTYKEYIEATVENIREFIKNHVFDDELHYPEKIRSRAFESDYVTGYNSGTFTNDIKVAEENAGEVIFDQDFIEDVHKYDVDLNAVMLQGVQATDVLARCLAMNHINIAILAEEERKRRKREREKTERSELG